MRNLKRILAVLLTIAMMASVMLVPAFAAGEELTAVEKVEILGLLKGESDEGLSEEYLSTNLRRMQVAILYARLIGIEEEAYAFDGWDEDSNFADYDDATSADEYNMLGFFYDDSSYGFIGTDMDEELGLMKFEPQSLATNKELAKILLTALGYEYGDYYDWDDILDFASSIGIDLGSSEGSINMNDVAEAMVMALEAEMADGTIFAQNLIDLGILTAEACEEAGINLTGTGEEGGTEELPTLEVKSVAGNNFAEVEFTFNQKIDPDSVKKENIKIDGSKLKGADKAYVVDEYGDGAVLRVFVFDGIVASQNEKREVSVTGVKTPNGTVMTGFTQEVMFRDSTAPSIEKIVAKGNSRLDIFISEPLQDSTDIKSLSNYKINGKSISGTAPEYKLDSDSNTGRIITLKKINNVLAAGTYELTINGKDLKFLDFAGNNMGFQAATFEIIDDKEGPIAQEVLSPVYPAKVQIQFDEEITEDATIYWNDGSKKKVSNSASVDGNVATFSFDSGKELPFTAATIYLQDCKDYSGNAAQAPTSFVVTAVPDSVRPEVVDYGSEKEGEFWVKFSKKINTERSAEWTIKESDGDKVYDVDWSLDADDSKIVWFTPINNAKVLGADTYTITLKGFKDRALPEANKMLETTIEVKIPDTVGPNLVKAWWNAETAADATTLNVFFSEKLDSSSANTRGNYKTIDSAKVSSSLPTQASPNLESGDRHVKIDVSKVKNELKNAMIYLQIADVQDLDGNEASQQYVEILKASQANDAKIARAAATSKTKIKLFVDSTTSGITTYDSSDFTLNTSKVSIKDATINTAGTELSLILDKELDADGTAGGTALEVTCRYLSGTVNNVVTNKFAVADEIKSTCSTDIVYGYNSSYKLSSSNAIALLFDERVQPKTITGGTQIGWTDIFSSLVVDGKTVYRTVGGDYDWVVTTPGTDDGNFYVLINFIGSKNIDAKDVQVNYAAAPNLTITDVAGNEMSSFNRTVNVRFMH